MALEVTTVVQTLMQQQNRLFAYIWTIVGDAQLAEDAMQELSVLAVNKGVEVADETRLIVWLWRSAKLKALACRRQKRLAPCSLDERLAEQLADEWLSRPTVSDSRQAQALQACIELLTPHNRELLDLRYLHGKKAGEIASLLGRKAATVYQSIARLHRSLRSCIEQRLAEEASS